MEFELSGPRGRVSGVKLDSSGPGCGGSPRSAGRPWYWWSGTCPRTLVNPTLGDWVVTTVLPISTSWTPFAPDPGSSLVAGVRRGVFLFHSNGKDQVSGSFSVPSKVFCDLLIVKIYV